MKKKIIAILCCVLLIFMVACNNQSKVNNESKVEDLSKKFTANNVETLDCDDTFATQYNELSASLLKNAYNGDNELISPLSIELAFSMLTNGAVGKTKEELENALSNLDIETLNKYNKNYVESIKNAEDITFNVANSLWFKNGDVSVKDEFLQTNADYYSAQVYLSNFDGSTLKDINDWVKTNTNGMIDKIIDEIEKDVVMYIINAIAFEAEWKVKFEEGDLTDILFHNLDGTTKMVEAMKAYEDTYIQGEKATGFLKAYKGDRYAFFGLLPNEGVGIDEFVNSLNAGSLKNYLTTTGERVLLEMPKMEVKYELDLIKIFQALGISEVFDYNKANLSDLATSSSGNIYVNKAKHKTFMQVDTDGTKAAAVTIIQGAAESVMQPVQNLKHVRLDRPYVYGIVDMETKMPIFIGTQTKF